MDFLKHKALTTIFKLDCTPCSHFYLPVAYLDSRLFAVLSTVTTLNVTALRMCGASSTLSLVF